MSEKSGAVHLEYANLIKASLTGAILTSTRLQNARLEAAELTGTDMRRAEISVATLSSVKTIDLADMREIRLTDMSDMKAGRLTAIPPAAVESIILTGMDQTLSPMFATLPNERKTTSVSSYDVPLASFLNGLATTDSAVAARITQRIRDNLEATSEDGLPPGPAFSEENSRPLYPELACRLLSDKNVQLDKISRARIEDIVARYQERLRLDASVVCSQFLTIPAPSPADCAYMTHKLRN